MEFQATSIADFLKGTIEGNPNATVYSISKIEDGKPGTLAFLANPKYNKYIYETEATIVLVNKDFVAEGEIKATLIRVDNAYEAFASLLDLYQQTKEIKKGIEKPSFIDESAVVGKDIYIGAFAYIGKNARIGNNVRIYPQVYIGDNVVVDDGSIIYAGVKIYEDCKIGKSCILHSGCVIGADGFGFAPTNEGTYKKIPQVGNVILEDNVEIGANTTVDRATMGSTIVHEGVKLDNLIQIAHNCEVGENTVMAALTGLAGSVKVGHHCTFGGQVGVAGHLSIGNNVTFGAMSGVTNNVKDDKVMLGAPAMDIAQASKVLVVYRRLPQLRDQLIRLEKDLAALKEQIGLK